MAGNRPAERGARRARGLVRRRPPQGESAVRRAVRLSNSTGFSNLEPLVMPRLALTYDLDDFAVFRRPRCGLASACSRAAIRRCSSPTPSRTRPWVLPGHHAGHGLPRAVAAAAGRRGRRRPVHRRAEVLHQVGFRLRGARVSATPRGSIRTSSSRACCARTSGSPRSWIRAQRIVQRLEPQARLHLQPVPRPADDGRSGHSSATATFGTNAAPNGSAIGLNGFAIDGRPIYRSIDPSVAGCTAEWSI